LIKNDLSAHLLLKLQHAAHALVDALLGEPAVLYGLDHGVEGLDESSDGGVTGASLFEHAVNTLEPQMKVAASTQFRIYLIISFLPLLSHSSTIKRGMNIPFTPLRCSAVDDYFILAFLHTLNRT